MSSNNNHLRELVLAALFLAIALVLPILTGQVPQIGSALCPMHIPALLCGFFCGPWYAIAVGFVAPLLRFLLFGMPPIFPTGIAMCFELATYGFVAAELFILFPKKKPYIYAALGGAMIAGRAVWGAARVVMYGLGGSGFSWAAFMTGAFANAVPGIIVQIILIPVLVMALYKFTYRRQ